MKEQYSGHSVSFNYWFCQKIKSSFHFIIYCHYKFFHAQNNSHVLFRAHARSLTIKAARKKYDEPNFACMQSSKQAAARTLFLRCYYACEKGENMPAAQAENNF